MLICDGFESFKRPYCLRRLNSTLNSTKNSGGESRYAPKGEYRRYSGLVPDYTSTKTSYSVVYLIRGYFIILYRTFVCQVLLAQYEHFFKKRKHRNAMLSKTVKNYIQSPQPAKCSLNLNFVLILTDELRS